MIVVSPHLDDAVFSVGQIIAAHPGTTIVTVCAGIPATTEATSYDQSAGFASSTEAVRVRRDEDTAAAATLDATVVHLDHLDGAYRDGPLDCSDDLRQWAGSDALIPVGIHHPDHIAVARHARDLAPLFASVWLYEELPYRVHYPEEAALRTWGTPDSMPSADVSRKAAAVECYRSQMSEMIRRTVYVPERVWKIR